MCSSHYVNILIDSCVELDTDYSGNDLTIIEDMATWHHCSIECRKRTDCGGWSWLAKTFAGGFHGRCHLKNSDYITGRKTLIGIVSGAKTCGGEDFNMIISYYNWVT